MAYPVARQFGWLPLGLGLVAFFGACSLAHDAAAACRSVAELAGFQPPCFVASPKTPDRLPPGKAGLKEGGLSAVRGVTIGPIESLLQPGRGYGSEAFAATAGAVRDLGGNWISLTVFGRVWNTDSAGVDLSFERPFEETRNNVLRSIQIAHARGLRVLLVPHLWVETGRWRAEIDPGSDEDWTRWASSYGRFVGAWADVAEEADADMFAVGVELRSWVTTPRVESFFDVIDLVRERYSGLLTYAANWDDVDDSMILGHLDVVGVNAFYPLHWEDGASYEQLAAGGRRVADEVQQLAERYETPVLFTEFGYTTRENTAIKPWLWPEELGRVPVDLDAQAEAYAALLSQMPGVPGFGGLFVWRMYADLADTSQEPQWGFSPWGKPALSVLEGTYALDFWGDPLP